MSCDYRAVMLVLLACIFLLGLASGLLLAMCYPKRDDAAFKEYLRREYGTKKQPKD